MAKSSFINKKGLTILVAILAIIAVGVGLYFLLKPKPDLLAPYNNMFDLKISENYATVQEYHDKLTNHLSDCYNTATTDEAKAPIKHTLDIYTQISYVTTELFLVDDIFQSNLAFTVDKDGKMVNIQRDMTSSYEKLTQIMAECVTYINDYLVDNKVAEVQPNQLFRYIENYNKIYYKYVDELANFYTLASEILANYTVDSFNVNPLTKYTTKTVAYWANNILDKLTNWTEDCSFAEISTSVDNLSYFVSMTYTTSILDNYYKYKEDYDVILANFAGVDFNACVERVANNSYVSYISEQTDAEIKTKLTTLGTEFFLVDVVGG